MLVVSKNYNDIIDDYTSIKHGQQLERIKQFIKFALIGGSGVIVNLLVIMIVTMLFNMIGTHENDIFIPLSFSDYNIRYYHIFTTIGFIVSNISNYQLNRIWTFKHLGKRPWGRGFIAFFCTGIIAFLCSQIVLTLLMNPTSPISLSSTFFNDSDFFHKKLYYASFIAICVSMPINFIINKLWAFRSNKDPIEEPHILAV